VACDNCAACGIIEQPYGVEIHSTDGIFIKQMVIPTAGTLVPQHSHTFDHLSMLATGAVRVWKDGVLVGDKVAPCGITIVAGSKHAFLALEDRTTIYCIHNLHGANDVGVLSEHQFAETA
jgi:hypothetical protein